MIAKVNEAAYKLELPSGSQVHPVFHVSQLRHCLHQGTNSSTVLPQLIDIPAVPVAVLQHRWRKKNGSMIEQVLIHWSNQAVLGDTWEDKLALQARFPGAEAWGQASSQGGGDVSAPAAPSITNGPSPHGSSLRGTAAAQPAPRDRRPNTRVTGPEWTK